MKLEKWEFIGIILICLLGAGLLYANELFENNQFVKLIAPINDSVWENLKLAFYAMIGFSLIEFIFIGKDHKNFIFSKAFSSLLACFLVVVLYYGYINILDQALYLDIIIFVLAIIIAQLFSYLILKTKLFISGLNYIGLLVIFAAVIAFASYTEHPNSHELFQNQMMEIED